VAHAEPAARDEFVADCRAALLLTATSVVPKTRKRNAVVWAEWTEYRASHGAPPDLQNLATQELRLCTLLVFGWRRRNTRTGKTGKPIRADTVAAALQAVGKGLTQLGFDDPRLTTQGSKIYHPLLHDFLEALRKQDDPSERAHPANITIISNMAAIPQGPLGFRHQAVHRLAILGFFWLLRPAEYLDGAGETRSQSFRLCDVSFEVDGTTIPATDASLNDVDVNRYTRASLTFTDQKNAVKGEVIAHAATSDPILCPCKVLARICANLRGNNADATTPLHTYYDPHGLARTVQPTHMTLALRRAARLHSSTDHIADGLLSARSLRPGGATALLCANIATDTIQLLGRWKSDAMMRYLRVAALAHTTPLAQAMLDAGAYTFAPNVVENNYLPVPLEAPARFLDALQREQLYNA
jgi:hypothetical protein